MATDRRRAALSLVLIVHLAALALSAVPDPQRLERVEGVRESSDDGLSAVLRPILDSGAEGMRALNRVVWYTTAPVRALARRYTDRLGITQTWIMFANPPRGEEYLRFRYFTVDRQDRLTVATELVFPKAPSSEARLVRAYWQAHQDKAISNAIVAYFEARTPGADGTLQRVDPERAPVIRRAFSPVVDYFSDQFAATLSQGTRLVRTETWYGYAQSRPRGEPQTQPVSRAAAIARYYAGLRGRIDASSKPVDSIETEADITWMLIYVRTP